MRLVKRFVLGAVKTNAYVIEQNQEIILIDAPGGIEKVIDFLQTNKLPLHKILLTHTHFDHIAGLNQLKSVFPEVEIYCPALEIPLIKEASRTLSDGFGEEITYQGEVKDVKLANIINMEVSYISGHSLMSAVYYFDEEKIMFSGDTLFRLSIGRSDFRDGNPQKLVSGIKEHLLTKDEEVKVYPGHGLATTIEREKRENPFLH